MDLHRKLLWIMIGALGIAALGGVLAVLSGGSDVVARTAGSAVLLAACAAVGIGFTRLTDSPAARAAGLTGLAFVVAFFVLLLGVIWEVADLLPLLDEGFLGMNAAWAVPAGVVATLAARFHREPGHRVAARVAVGLLVVSTVLFEIYAISLNLSVGYTLLSNLFASAIVVGLLGLPGAVSLAGWRSWAHRPWRWLGLAASPATIGMSLWGIWLEIDEPGALFVSLVALAVTIALANLLLELPLVSWQRHVRTATVLAAAVAGAMATLMAYDGLDGGDDHPIARFTAAGVVLAASGTLMCGLFAILNRRVEAAVVTPEHVRGVKLICPHCGQAGEQPLGASACARCGLRFRIEVEEPRCRQCGYALYHLKGDACPECGAKVEAEVARE